MEPRLRQQRLDERRATPAGVEGHRRLVFADLRRQLRVKARGHVWQVGDDQVEPAWQKCQQLALDEIDPARHAVCGGVASRERQRLPRRVDRDDARRWAVYRDRHGDRAAAGTDIGDPGSRVVGRGSWNLPLFPAVEPSDGRFHQQLRLRPGDERGRSAGEAKAVELPVPDDIRRGLVVEATAEQRLEGCMSVCRERLPKAREERLAGETEGMAEQYLRL